MISFFTLNGFCIAILCVILINIVKVSDKRIEKNMFAMFVISTLILCSINFIWGIVKIVFHQELSQDLSYMVNLLHYYFMGVVAYIWFLFSEKEQNSKIVESWWGILISIIPMIIYTVISVGSYKFEWLFKYEIENGSFIRGDFYFTHILICLFYPVFTSVTAVIKGFKKENIKNRKQLLSLAIFPLFPVAVAVVQMLFHGSSFVPAAITVAALQMYLDSRERLISLDPMTNLNNKYQLYHYLDSKMRNKSDSNELYLFMMDMDKFKSINDRYGHIEGDEAIIIVADVLQDLVSESNYFACRYGGDEFAIVCEESDEFDPKEFSESINVALTKRVEELSKPYSLSISVGYIRYTDLYENIPDFISAADSELYKVKRSRSLRV